MRAPRSRGRQRMVPLRSAGRTAYRGREPPQRCQPRHGHPPRGSDNSARVATIFIYNGAPPALVGCLGPSWAARSLFALDERLRGRQVGRNRAQASTTIKRRQPFTPSHETAGGTEKTEGPTNHLGTNTPILS